jgi:hypothetical protein
MDTNTLFPKVAADPLSLTASHAGGINCEKVL